MADPLTLAIGAGGALLGKLFGGGGGASPAAPPPAAPPIQQPVGSQTSGKPAGAPSFLGAAATPQQQNTATKSLLGQ